MGASAVFEPRDSQWRKKAKDLLGERWVGLAIDNVGGALLPEMIDALGYEGKVSVVGRLAGPVPQFNTASLFFRRIRLGGVAVGTYTNTESRAAWAEVVRLLGRRGMRPIVDRTYRFDEAPAAFARLAEGPMGKVLVSSGSQ